MANLVTEVFPFEIDIVYSEDNVEGNVILSTSLDNINSNRFTTILNAMEKAVITIHDGIKDPTNNKVLEKDTHIIETDRIVKVNTGSDSGFKIYFQYRDSIHGTLHSYCLRSFPAIGSGYNIVCNKYVEPQEQFELQIQAYEDDAAVDINNPDEFLNYYMKYHDAKDHFECNVHLILNLIGKQENLTAFQKVRISSMYDPDEDCVTLSCPIIYDNILYNFNIILTTIPEVGGRQIDEAYVQKKILNKDLVVMVGEDGSCSCEYHGLVELNDTVKVGLVSGNGINYYECVLTESVVLRGHQCYLGRYLVYPDHRHLVYYDTATGTWTSIKNYDCEPICLQNYRAETPAFSAPPNSLLRIYTILEYLALTGGDTIKCRLYGLEFESEYSDYSIVELHYQPGIRVATSDRLTFLSINRYATNVMQPDGYIYSIHMTLRQANDYDPMVLGLNLDIDYLNPDRDKGIKHKILYIEIPNE